VSAEVGVYSTTIFVVKPVEPDGTAVAANDTANLALLDEALNVVAASNPFAVTGMTVFTFYPLAEVIHLPLSARITAPFVQVVLLVTTPLLAIVIVLVEPVRLNILNAC
jgi:hypothetical protein